MTINPCRRLIGWVANPFGSLRLFYVPVTVFLIGAFSITLLLWVHRIDESLRVEEELSDIVTEAQISAATAHLWLEVAFQGDGRVDVKQALAGLERAITLFDSTLLDSDAGDEAFQQQLRDQRLRVRLKEIRSLLEQFRTISIERLRDPHSGSGTDLDRKHDDVYRAFVEKAQPLAEDLKKGRTEHKAMTGRLYFSIITIWTFVVLAAAAVLWRLEIRRRETDLVLKDANRKLSLQADELREHREHLSDLVERKTASLTDANLLLETEIAGHKKAEEELRQSQTELRNLSSRLLAAQEDERKRISRELHDELGQSLTLVKFQLRSIEKIGAGRTDLTQACRETLQSLNDIIESIRRLSRDLSPYLLEDLGLTRALKRLCRDFNNADDMSLTTDIADIDFLFSKADQINIYRIIQEALTNIVKHSGAQHASVIIGRGCGGTTFSIDDDGVGFDMEKISAKYAEPGLGLAGIAERIRMLGGVADICSVKGDGTRISFYIPDKEVIKTDEPLSSHAC